MPVDPRLDRWLQEWEARRLREPSLTPEDFLAGLAEDVPPELLHDIRRAMADMDWVTDVMRRMKAPDRRRGAD